MDFKASLYSAQKHLSRSDPRLAAIIKKYGDCLITPHTDHYSELVSSIVGQQLSVKAAATIWQRVLVLSGGNPPTPAQLIEADTETLRACGLSYAKVRYVKDLAEHILDGRLDMAHIAGLPNEEIIAQLTAVKGLGEWSAHMFLIFGLGRLDVLPVGDLGIKKAAQSVYGLGDLPDKEALQKIAKANGWAPYESVASWYLWKSLDNTPVKTRHSS
ncbi:DNA-3-methyladenine glycosylase [Candidatus Saccharibacteria bacterium]|nr:DNA-3-methyladenine glycosylase [Candidatus Saccharibacteria bacterium]